MSEEKSKFTESAKVDYIREYLEESKEYRDIIESFISRPGGTFLFNPLLNDTIFQFFREDPEEFLVWVKAATVLVLEGWDGSKTANQAKEYLTIKIADSNEIKMHDWDASYEGVPVAVNCQVIGAFNEETYTKKAMVYCPACHTSETIKNLSRMPRCPNKECENYRTPMEIARASLKTGPVKMIMIQEPLEEAKHSSPKIFPCIIKDDDVKKTFIGQRKRIIGTFMSEPQKYKSTNRITIHAISVHDLDDVEEMQPTDEQIEQFTKMSKEDNYISKIVDSYSPEIRYGGSELAKLCIILSILGGVRIGRLRGFVHCLLVGDPSTAKSKMLEFMPLVVQKSGFAVGGTASGAGITVSMDTLPNRMKMPRAGLIPNCTGGCAAIDELNQLDDEDLGKIFESMESGKIHYNKGGFDVILSAETAIQSGTNPRGYYYDKKRTILDNIHLPGPLIQRFDLKLNLLSNQSNTEETNIRKHISIIRDIGVEEYVARHNLLTPQELMILFNYAKSFTPKMSPEADKLLNDFDERYRQIEQEEGSLSPDRRFFESIGRITLAYTKLHFSNIATPEHAMTAIEIFKKTLKTFGMNVEAGAMQLSMEESGKTKETAFVYVFKDQQIAQKITFLQEEPVLKAMIKHYRRFWKNLDEAAIYFEQMHKKGKLEKRAGRYNLE